MNLQLFKSETAAWSGYDPVAKGTDGEGWKGVRNYQARNFMRQMKIGDIGFYYHSQSEKYVVGVVSIIAESHQDSTIDDQRQDCVDVVTIEPLAKPNIINCGSATDCYLDRQHHVRLHATFVFQVFHVLSHQIVTFSHSHSSTLDQPCFQAFE